MSTCVLAGSAGLRIALDNAALPFSAWVRSRQQTGTPLADSSSLLMDSKLDGPMSNLPESARRLMAEIGPKWGTDNRAHTELVLSQYAPLLRRSPKAGIIVTRDHAYGSHPRHRLDVFAPQVTSLAPVVVFVHGGAFVRGEKTDGEVYDNVLYWFARHGCVGINVEYRLAPESAYPSGAQDVAAAVAWTQAHASEFGGVPGKIFLVGHSAGATHIAGYVADPNVPQKPPMDLGGVVLLSGRLDIDVRPENPNAGAVRSYFGENAALYESRSPMSYAHQLRQPLMVVIAEFDNPFLDVYGAEFMWRVSASRGRAPRFLQLRHHNHMSMVAHFNTGEELLGQEILSFILEGC